MSGVAGIPVDRPEPAVGKSVRKGLGWSVINTVTGRLGSLVSGMILARLLTPEDYGAFAVAMVVLTAVLSFNELGVSLAIIRWPDDPARIAPTVNTLSVISSVLLYAVCFAAAPMLANVLSAPDAAGMIRVVCVCVLFDGLTASGAALIARGLYQERRFAVDIIGFLLGTALSVTLATMGLGGWSMIWGLVLTSLLSGAATLVLTPQRYGFGMDRTVVFRLLRFGGPLAGSSLLLFAMLNIDYVVVGHLLGVEALGLYLMAFNLCSWPVNVISVTVRRVSLATFARAVGAPAQFRRTFLVGLTAILTATLAICVPLALLARPVLRVVYGPQWTPAATTLSLLCVFALGRILVEYAYDYFIARDRNHFNLLIQGIWLVTLIPVLIVGANVAGIAGVGAGQAAVVVFVVLPVLFAGLSPDLGVRRLLSAARRPILTSLPVVLICVASLFALSRPLLVLVIGGGAGTLMYVALNMPIVKTIRHGRPQTA